jgi:hypothetical protein
MQFNRSTLGNLGAGKENVVHDDDYGPWDD